VTDPIHKNKERFNAEVAQIRNHPDYSAQAKRPARVQADPPQVHLPEPEVKPLRNSEARWSGPRLIRILGPFREEWHEWLATKCLPGVVAEADRRRTGGAASLLTLATLATLATMPTARRIIPRIYTKRAKMSRLARNEGANTVSPAVRDVTCAIRGPSQAQARWRGMSRGPNLLVKMSAVKRTFATQKSACIMDSETGSETGLKWSVNPGTIYSHMRQRHGL
jgi:hypothetical protein